MGYSKERILVLTLAAVLSAPMRGASDEKKEKAKLPPELEQVFGIALAAPPEFASDALLRLSGKIGDKDLRRDLLDMAFHVAAGARSPYALEGLPNANPETDASAAAAASRLGLDVLSLQARAVQEMLPLDPVRGRQLFGEMPRPSLPVGNCAAPLLPDISAYYDALGAVTRAGFTDAERARTEQVGFAVGALSRVSSVREIAPAARVIAALDWPRNRFEIALGTFITRLDGMSGDSRSFLPSANAIDAGIAQLVGRARQLGSLPDSLVASYRRFLVAQFRAPRCADSEIPAGRIVQDGQPQGLFGDDIRGDAAPLDAAERMPETIEGEARLERYWQTEPAQRVFQEATLLRTSANGTNHTEAARRTREWSRQFGDFLNTLAGWKPGDEPSEAIYFHQKATVYEALLELAPAGESADLVISNFISFLKHSALQQTRPAEWFWHARTAVDRVRADRPEQAAKIAAGYRAAGSIILVLESMLDEIAPRSAFQP